MRRLNRLWHTLAEQPVLAGVEAVWVGWLGDEIEMVRPYLSPRQARSAIYPCHRPKGEGCPRRVVQHASDDIVAVCGCSPPQCDTVRLGRQDIVVHELSISRFAADIARTLGVDPPGASPLADLRGVHELGIAETQTKEKRPVLLALGGHDDAGVHPLELLLLRHGRCPFIVIVPVPDVPLPLRRLFDEKDCKIASCAHLLGWEENEGFLADGEVWEDLLRAPATGYIFQKEGSAWRIAFNCEPINIPHSEGLERIHALLAHQGEEVRIGELLRESARSVGSQASDESTIEELEGEIAALCNVIESESDQQVIAEAQDRLQRLKEHLQAQLGLRGKPRRIGDETKRMADRVGKSITREFERLEQNLPELAAHLRKAIDHPSSGAPSYRPAESVTWLL